MARPESSLCAAVVVRGIASDLDIPCKMIGAQKVKKRLTGDGNAAKNLVRAALLRQWPDLANEKPWNEHISDAMGLGALSAEEE